PERRSDPGDRSRRDRRTRLARRAAGGQRTVPAVVRQAVQVRDRSIHQPRGGLHAGTRTAGGGPPSRRERSLTMDESVLFGGVMQALLGGRRRRGRRAMGY